MQLHTFRIGGTSMVHGGQVLRTLRLRLSDAQGKHISLERLADAAGISYEGLSNIERGRTKHPPRSKIMKILDALGSLCYPKESLRLQEKNNVLDAFGYEGLFSLPVPHEYTQTIEKWTLENKDSLIPSYLVDITQHILCWNTYSQKTSGIEIPAVEHHIYSLISKYTIFDIMFSKHFAPVRKNVLNQNIFFSLLLSTIKSELITHKHDQWYIDLIHDTSIKYPEFSTIWQDIKPMESSKTRFRFGPISINHKNTILNFEFQSFLFNDDIRFTTVQYLPCDTNTILIWNQWVSLQKTS